MQGWFAWAIGKPMTMTDQRDPNSDSPSRPLVRRGVTILALGIVAALLVGGAAGAFWGQDDGRAVVKMRGTAVLETMGVGGGTLTQLEGDRMGIRSAAHKGKISLTLPDRRLTGVLTTTLNAEFVGAATGPSITHAWGTAKAVLEGSLCKGTYGYSHYYDPREVGGSLNLRCGDGSVLGGTYYLDKSEVVAAATYREYFQLTDGFYLPPT